MLLSLCQQYNATLVVVSKTRTEKEIMALHGKGQRIFGENRVHELIIKASLLPNDIEWHLIGHLQTNKVRSVLPYVACIQSLDSWKLWQKINEEAREANLHIPCLLQIKIASEVTKYGWTLEELQTILQKGDHEKLVHVKCTGVMGMASLTNDMETVRHEFRQLKASFEMLKKNYFSHQPYFSTISMGMSGDYHVALEEGSNMIRIGSMLFPPGR
jgi:pyridoxal phosphate enzyme (YggS family)